MFERGGTLKEAELAENGAYVAIPEILQNGDMAIFYWQLISDPPEGANYEVPLRFYKPASGSRPKADCISVRSNNPYAYVPNEYTMLERGGRTLLAPGAALGDSGLFTSSLAKGYYTIVKSPQE